ncbi:hypothetical protein K443DRAFT_113917, partial [Laccaria amethystina LaAM-08-1]
CRLKGQKRQEVSVSTFQRYFAISMACLNLFSYGLKGQKRPEVCVPALRRYVAFSVFVGSSSKLLNSPPFRMI